ncbi:hypothetical protein SCHPADRAFT_896404 [Schizopora paradoxa]|uniref:Uncharacterized protein n=1 Tax=Schizopora paradoxa TaxID=27342 RepID=A0A0H2R0F8_9AGAM|nr:hypothetical protein SCHPADRAFT_896404 [Schizopora paradoxa]
MASPRYISAQGEGYPVLYNYNLLSFFESCYNSGEVTATSRRPATTQDIQDILNKLQKVLKKELYENVELFMDVSAARHGGPVKFIVNNGIIMKYPDGTQEWRLELTLGRFLYDVKDKIQGRRHHMSFTRLGFLTEFR